MNVVAGRYTVSPGLTFVEMLAAGRKIRHNGSAHQFADLPFAKDVEGWTVGGRAFLWAAFSDDSYWLWHEGSHYGLIPRGWDSTTPAVSGKDLADFAGTLNGSGFVNSAITLTRQ